LYVPKTSSRLPALAAGVLAIAAGLTCADSRLTGPGSRLRAAVEFLPSFSREAAKVYRNLAAFEFQLDNMRVRLLRANQTVAVDTVVAIPPGQESIAVELSVTLERSPEEFEAKIELRDGEQVLFASHQTVTAQSGGISRPPAVIELEYAGPGSEVVSLDVAPDTTMLAGDSLAMRSVARDGNNQVVPDLAFDWSLSDATMGTVSRTGIFKPAKRGSVVITAELPTGVSGSATVEVVAPAASLALVSGGNQSGPTGRALEQPIVVEVRASDNIPVAGHSVTFAVTAGGGSVAPTSALTNATGRASAILTLGASAGTNTVQVTATGLAPITVSATGVQPQPATRHWVGGTNVVWETPTNWSGGVVPGVQDTVVIDQDGAYAVSINSAVSIAKLIVGGSTGQQTLFVPGGTGTLTVTDSIRVMGTGALTVGSVGTGTVLTSGPILVHGILQWLGGDIGGSGNIDLTANASMVISGGATMGLSNRTLRNGGVVVFGGNDAGHLSLRDGAGIQNFVEAEFFVQGEVDILQGSGAAGSITNQGFYRKLIGNAGAHSIGVAFVNSGTVEILEGTVAFAGPSLVNQANGFVHGVGTIDVSATTFQNAGTIEPGVSPGRLNVVGPLTQQTTSRLVIELAGTTAETLYDVLAVTGAVTLAGTLEVELMGYVPTAGDSLTVMQYTSRTGTFTNLIGLNLGGGLFLDPVYTSTGLSLVVRQVAANTITWVNAAGGNWSVGANWSTGVAPVSTDVVGIELAGTYTVTLDVNPTIAGLNLGGSSGVQTLSGTSRTLTVNGNATVATTGVLTLATSTLAGTGSLANSGSVVLQGGTVQASFGITNQGLLQTHGAVSLLGPLSTAPVSTIRLLGQNTGGTAALTVANGFSNNGILELTSTSGHAATLAVTSGTLTNSALGRISSLTSGTRTLAAQLDNQGYLEVDAPLTINRASSAHVNSGTIDLSTADLTVTQSGTTPSFSNAGLVTLGASRDWTVTGGLLDVTGGTVTGPGTARLIVSNATFAFATANVGLLPLTLTNTAIAGGQVAIPDGETLTLLNGALSDPVSVHSGGTLLVHGAVSLTGALSLPTGSTLRLMGQNIGGTSALTVASSVTNNGTIELTSTSGHAATLSMPAGTLTNASGAQIRSLTSGTRTLAVQLDNQGTLDVDAPLTLNQAEADHLNSGTIDLSTADLTVTQTGATPSFTSTGTVTLGASRDWTVTGGALDIDQGTVTGPLTARLLVSNASLAFTTANVGLLPLTLTNTTIAGGSVTIPAGQTLTLLGGALGEPITVQGGGTLLTHGAVTLSGAMTLPAGSMLRLMGQNIGGTSTLTLTTNVVNNGTIELTSTSGHAATLSMPTTTLTNSGSALIRSIASGTRTLAVELDNQGTLEIDAPTTINRADADHLNTGTIDLTTADLTVTQTGTATPSFTHVGTLNLGASRDWTVTGGTLDIDQGIITSTLSSRLLVSNASLQFTTASVGLLPLTLTNTTILGGSVTIPNGETLTLLNGGLSVPVTVQSGGTVLVHGAVTIGGAITMPAGAMLRLMGQNIGGTAALTLSSTLTNAGTIELTSTSGHAATLSMPAGTTLANASGGQIRSLASGTRTLAAQLDNQAGATLEVDALLTINRASAVHTNSGTIDLTTADLVLTQSGVPSSFTNFSTGTITLGTSRDWTVNGGTLDIDEGTVTGPVSSRLIASGALIQLTTGNVTLPLTITTSSVNGGTITVPTGQTLTLLNGNLSETITIQSGGTMLTHGSVAVTGLSMPTGSLLQIMGQNTGGTANLAVTTSFTNNGTIELTSTSGHASILNMPVGTTLTNAAGGLIHTMTSGSRLLNVQLNNLGTLTLDNALTMNRPDVVHTNSGAINVNANLTLSLSGTPASFTNFSTGTITLAASQDWTVNGGTLDIDEGTVTGPVSSRLIVNNSAMQMTTGNVTLPLTLTNTGVNGGSLDIGSGTTLTLLNGGLNDPVTVGNGGTLRIHGAVALGGTLSIPGGTVEVMGQNTGGTATLTVANGFSNFGTIDLTSTSGHASALTVTAGTLTNGTGATIRTTGSGTRTLAADLDNQGSLMPGGNNVPGTFALTRNWSQVGSTGNLWVDLSSAGSYDQVNITGTAARGGTLTVQLVGGFQPAIGNTFTIMTHAGGSTGTFGQVVLPTLPGDRHWVVTPNATSLVLSVAAGP
jgi:hypothetical protein